MNTIYNLKNKIVNYKLNENYMNKICKACGKNSYVRTLDTAENLPYCRG